jgi:hypothetical protein
MEIMAYLFLTGKCVSWVALIVFLEKAYEIQNRKNEFTRLSPNFMV